MEEGVGGQRRRQIERVTELRREGENKSYIQMHTISKDGKWRKRGTYNRKREKSRRNTDSWKTNETKDSESIPMKSRAFMSPAVKKANGVGGGCCCGKQEGQKQALHRGDPLQTVMSVTLAE